MAEQSAVARGEERALRRDSGETGSLRRDPSRTRVAGDGVTFSRCRTAKSVAGNGWTEVVASKERREKRGGGGGLREGGRRKGQNEIWKFPKLPLNPSLISITTIKSLITI